MSTIRSTVSVAAVGGTGVPFSAACQSNERVSSVSPRRIFPDEIRPAPYFGSGAPNRTCSSGPRDRRETWDSEDEVIAEIEILGSQDLVVSLSHRLALQKLDGNSLRAADETHAHARAHRGRLLGELDALAFELSGDRVDA